MKIEFLKLFMFLFVAAFFMVIATTISKILLYLFLNWLGDKYLDYQLNKIQKESENSENGL